MKIAAQDKQGYKGTYSVKDSQGPCPDLFHLLPDSKSFHQHHHVYLSVKYLSKVQMEQVLGECREIKETYLGSKQNKLPASL